MGNAQPAGDARTNQPRYLAIGGETNKYAVRLYQSYFTASIAGTGTRDQKFMALASYIGVFSMGGGANEKRMSMAMTSQAMERAAAPAFAGTVFTSSAGGEVMSFILPFHLKRIEDVPLPTDRRITLKAVPNQVIAAVRFSGVNHFSYINHYPDTNPVTLPLHFLHCSNHLLSTYTYINHYSDPDTNPVTLPLHLLHCSNHLLSTYTYINLFLNLKLYLALIYHFLHDSNHLLSTPYHIGIHQCYGSHPSC